MLVVRLIYRFDQNVTGFVSYHIHIIGTCVLLTSDNKENSEASFGNIPISVITNCVIRKIYRIRSDLFSDPRSRIGINSLKDLALVKFFQKESSVIYGSHNVNVTRTDSPSAMLGIFFRNKSVCLTCREMSVIKYPYLHVAFFAFGKDDIHISPPIGAAKIVMRARFHTKSTATAVINALYLFRYTFSVISVLPIKRQHIICFITEKHFLKTCIAHNIVPFLYKY